MHTNAVQYTLLCESCKRVELNSMSVIRSAESYINFSRSELIEKCNDLFAIKKCGNCGVKGKYSIWEIWCGERPIQIHIQIQEVSYRKLTSDFWDEKQIHLNPKLEQLNRPHKMILLLRRALKKVYNKALTIEKDSELPAEIRETFNIDEFTNDLFYAIYEERCCENNSNGGELVYVDNNFKSYNLSRIMEKVAVFYRVSPLQD